MECDTLTAVHARQYAAINYTHIFANISSRAHTCAVPVCKRVVMILCHNWNIPCCDDGPIHCVACVGLHDFTPPDVVLSMGRVKHSVSMHVWIQGNNGAKCSLSAATARIFWLGLPIGLCGCAHAFCGLFIMLCVCVFTVVLVFVISLRVGCLIMRWKW